MDATTIATLLLPACPALPAVCLYRATHRGTHRARATAAAWLLTPAAVVGPVLGAQHTHGWGVVGWMMQLATAVVCVLHLSGIRARLLLPGKRRRRKAKGRRTERYLQIPLQAMVTWGHDFWGGHRPFTQPRQTVTEHRAEVSGQVLEPLPDDRADWERRINDILYSNPEEEQPEYNEAPRVSLEEHRAQLRAQLTQGK